MKPRASRPASRGGAIPLEVKRQAKRLKCSICKARYGQIEYYLTKTPLRKIWIPRENLDHVLPVRWCRQHGYSPNVVENIVSCCHRCNLAKKGAEDALFAGRALDFVKLLIQHGWHAHLLRALQHYRMDMMIGLVRNVAGAG